ncbi:MAG: hypothetical protein A2Z29_03560 [Chloroflexi bacterium RBG_16_56_11]|nr:MAG: hypothetical protein A2Z29_03560 [Chloroflexi bacterium RBG_16_56_11]
MPVTIGKTLYVNNRKSWRVWLAKNHDREKEIWLIYYRKATGKQRISYNNAVEEALCFGWIDSTVKKVDEERFAQRFSVRNKTSGLSQANKERIIRLIAQKKMTPAGLAAVAHVFQPAALKEEKIVIAPDILWPLRADEEAWENFQKMPDVYKRGRIAYLESRRRHGQEMFEKSLRHFIKMTAKNKRIGFIRE